MSKEYIERKAVIGFLENMAASRYLIQCFESKEKFPAADVVEVRRGEWVERIYDEVPHEPYLLYHCSLCDEPNARKKNYCPNCGAKMMEVNNNVTNF